MSTSLSDLCDPELLAQLLASGHLRREQHPDLALVIYNYTAATQFDRVWNDVTLRCRGLITDTSGVVVARPFPKFFNYAEHESGSLPSGVVHVTDKLDGSLGILYPVPGGHALSTRGRFSSPQARHATEVWRERYAGRFFPNPAWTYLFEIIYPANRIVVDYGDLDDLVLIGAVETETGSSVPLVEVAASWPGPVVEEMPYRTLSDALSAPARPNREGVVVHFVDDDVRVKIKHDEYVRLHRLVTGVSERRIWEALSAGVDLHEWLEAVPDEFYRFVVDTRTRLLGEFERLHTEVTARYDELVGGLPDGWTRKDFALGVGRVDWPLARALFLVLDGSNFDHLVWRELRPAEHVPLFAQHEDAN